MDYRLPSISILLNKAVLWWLEKILLYEKRMVSLRSLTLSGMNSQIFRARKREETFGISKGQVCHLLKHLSRWTNPQKTIPKLLLALARTLSSIPLPYA
jgi:hypothetical protein